MGYRPYFLKIAEKYPDLIANHHVLNHAWDETVKIGGIGGRIEITDILEMWMPYKYGGECTRLNIGLSDDLPITCIVGIPFATATKCVYDADENKVTSKLLGCTWKVTMKMAARKLTETLEYPGTSHKVTLPGMKQ
jgi:hypothetical protein